MNKRVLLFLLLVCAAPAQAQSLFGTRGLGVPVDAIDPRARTLGNVGLGLIGLNTSMVNPAEIAGIRRRGITAALQPFFASEELAGVEDNVSGTRFPLVHLIYPPTARLVIGLGYGGVMDQSWAIFATSRQLLGADSINVRDRVATTGAVAQVRVSAGYELSSRFSVGLAGGVYTGGIERETTRTFPDSIIYNGFSTRQNWNYSAPFFVAGLRYDPSASARVSAALTWSGKLDAESENDGGTDYSYSLPLRLSVGASGLINSRLLANASAQWSKWNETDNFAAAGSPADLTVNARPTWEVGGGLEWEELRAGSRIFPIRVGLRYAQLPFHQEADDPAKELTGSFGLGLRLAADDFGPLAVADFGVERGKRTGWTGALPDGLRENFWRFNASITLFGR
jgi:hypothetical protein